MRLFSPKRGEDAVTAFVIQFDHLLRDNGWAARLAGIDADAFAELGRAGEHELATL